MEIENKIKKLIFEALKNLNTEADDVSLEFPGDFKMGHYSSNVVMVLFSGAYVSNRDFTTEIRKEKYDKETSKLEHQKLFAGYLIDGVFYKNPKDLALRITEELNKNLPKDIERVETAGPGFINFYLSKEFFVSQIQDILENEDFGKSKVFENKKIMVEYTQPNPFKPFHIGHLMSNAIGESISRLVEYGGANTIRANYQGDVGLHVAKAIWGISFVEKRNGIDIFFDNNPEVKFNIKKPEENDLASEKANFIGNCYHVGSTAYESWDQAKKEIDEINKKIYQKNDEKINEIYVWGREITLEAFEKIYKILGTHFDYYFFESEMGEKGIKIVRENTPKVFAESNGAIIFEAQNHDPKLHTRVFITSQGLPAYEAKEIGLTFTKFEKEKDLDLSIVTTAIEQGEYMKVVEKSISLINEDYQKKMKHITHGMMRFASGKMSSRKGNVITGESLINDVKEMIIEKIKDRDFSEEEKEKVSYVVGVSALKYSILKQMLGKDTIYDFEKSISFEGDSGPYLQYAFARANKVLEKGKEEKILPDTTKYQNDILELEILLSRFPKIVERSQKEFAPHHIANYLIELSRAFNSFYGNTQIIDKENENISYNLALTFAFGRVVKKGLWLLGVETLERM